MLRDVSDVFVAAGVFVKIMNVDVSWLELAKPCLACHEVAQLAILELEC
jgi:hypothetical protein